MSKEHKFQVYVTLRHESGPEKDEETMLDYFCGQLGEQNGARPPMRLVVDDYERDEKSVYVVELVDDRP